MATTSADDANKSVLQLFDPLTSPMRSPSSQTPSAQRQRDPTSPVAAFFSSVDRSRNLLATIKKTKEPNLIDLGLLQSPLPNIHENVGSSKAMQSTAHTFATPIPLNKTRTIFSSGMEKNVPPTAVFDPFSPPAGGYNAVSMHSAVMTPKISISMNKGENGRLISIETPARTDLLMSTAFTPVPGNLPYLPGVSLRSLAASTTSSTATKRRRSSIDLGKELQHVPTADSSFDILRGEMEIGTSAEVSFISTDAEDMAKMQVTLASLSIEESPWTMRTASSHYSLGDELLPIKDLNETPLLAHRIPLPDSPPSPSGETNEDACLNAPKVFPNLRRFSIAKLGDSPLEFPVEDASPPRDSNVPLGLPSMGQRRSTFHTRTVSTTSVTSIGSNQSAVTVTKLAISSPKKTTNQSDKSILNKHASPLRRGAAGSRAPSSVASSPSKPSPTARRVPRPSVTIKPLVPRVPSTGPRASLAVGSLQKVASIPASTTASKGPTRPRGSMAPPPIPASSSGLARPRMSTATLASRPSISRPATQNPMVPRRVPRPSVASTVKGETEKVLTTGTRANTSATRVLPRQSLLPSVGERNKATTNKGPGSTDNVTAMPIARPRPTGGIKPRPSSMIIPPSTVTQARNSEPDEEVEVVPSKPMKAIPRPRTSSAGAALMSRPSIGGEQGVQMRPVSVAAHRINRPKSSMSRV